MPKFLQSLPLVPIEDGQPVAFYTAHPQSDLETLSESTIDPDDLISHMPSDSEQESGDGEQESDVEVEGEEEGEEEGEDDEENE